MAVVVGRRPTFLEPCGRRCGWSAGEACGGAAASGLSAGSVVVSFACGGGFAAGVPGGASPWAGPKMCWSKMVQVVVQYLLYYISFKPIVKKTRGFFLACKIEPLFILGFFWPLDFEMICMWVSFGFFLGFFETCQSCFF